jgi:aminopeptidase-like protein
VSETSWAAQAAEAHALVRELYPLCRSITGNGVRRTLDRVARIVPLERFEVPSGTALFDWEVPREWNVREAWVRDPSGRKVVDFAEHNLHLVSYSAPFRGRVPLAELRAHLHTLPERPDWIPYRTSYYREDWGFCLRHRDFERLADGEYEVCVDTTLAPGSLSYAQAVIQGTSAREAVVYTHTCHPSLANDNLTGIAVAALVARAMAGRRPRLTHRFVFGPGTIGSLAWLAANERGLGRIEHVLVLGLLGDRGPLRYKRSRAGTATIDRVAEHLLPRLAADARILPFEPYGYDERQFCSPGFNLPAGRLTRSPNGAYAEYHSSADDPDFVTTGALAESLEAATMLLAALDDNRALVNQAPKGEPKLGKRGLYGSIGGRAPADAERAMLWVLNQSDGTQDLLAIAERSGLPFGAIVEAAHRLEQAGLLAAAAPDGQAQRSPT